jgi:DNA-binding transcriptional ArsR family regulator
MSTNVESLLSLDRLVHEPARLVILTMLAETEEAEFTFLQRVSGLTKGNLSSHISKLEAAGYLEVRKSFRGKVPATSLKITRMGRTALRNYRKRLRHGLRGET